MPAFSVSQLVSATRRAFKLFHLFWDHKLSMDSHNEPPPDLVSDDLPILEDITSQQAIWYVIKMLERLVWIHEASNNEISNDFLDHEGRRHSYDNIALDADMVSRRLSKEFRPCNNLEEESFTAESSDCSIKRQPTRFLRDLNTDILDLYKRFWLKDVPDISIPDYLFRFHKFCRSSPSTYLAAGRYIYELCAIDKKLPLTRNNVYRLFCSAFLIAAKFVEDLLYPVERYATTAGVKKSDLSTLEISLLFLIEFNLKVDYDSLLLTLKMWASLNETYAAMNSEPELSENQTGQVRS